MNSRAMLVAKTVSVILLLWALFPGNPYAYYVLLRWISCPALAYLAFCHVKDERIPMAWVFGTAAGLYNPVLPLHLTRTIWSMVNVACIAIIVTSIFLDRAKMRQPF